MNYRVEIGDGVHYTGLLIRISKKGYRRLDTNSYGYVVTYSGDGLVSIDNGIRIDLVNVRDIDRNYGKNVRFIHRSDLESGLQENELGT